MQSPFYVTTWPKVSREQDIETYLGAVRKWITEVSSPWSTVVDMSGFEASSSTAGQRRAFAQLLRGVVEGRVARVALRMLRAPQGLLEGVEVHAACARARSPTQGVEL